MNKSLLLINLGTPDKPTYLSVFKYLRQFLMDGRVININPILRYILVNFIICPIRSFSSTKIYKEVWDSETGSPLLHNTQELTKKISQVIKIPTIGIGAGLETDGQIMVVHDMLGVSCLEKPPKFIKNFLEKNDSIFEAIEDYVNSVKSSTFPAKENWFD